MATSPVPPPKPRLEDPQNVQEIFATEVVGIGSIHGNLAVTLAAVRFDEPAGAESPKARRIVTGRLILTGPAASQLLQSLHKLAMPQDAQRPTVQPSERN
jgi:hypothetical protein